MRILKLACAFWALGAGPALAASPADLAAFERVKAAYEQAFNSGDMERLWPLIDSGLRVRTVTGEEIVGREGIKAYWQKVRALMARGGGKGSYHVEVQPGEMLVNGDRASAKGHSVEELRTGDGQLIRYRSEWSVDLQRRGTEWVIMGWQARPDLRDVLTAAVADLAWRLWTGRFNFKLGLSSPDFDQDHGRHAAGALPAANISAPPPRRP